MAETDTLAAPFDVTSSFTGRAWRLRAPDERATLLLSQRLGVPEIFARLLASRGVGVDEADRFLNPTLKDGFPDPSHLKDMDRAAERLTRAVQSGEPIAIFGDYDVDGATSTALLLRFFRAVGANATFYIPDRLKEGYGPNGPALRALAAKGVKVVVTVDCGTTAHAALAEGKEAGLDVIVVDHHVAEPALPLAYAVVNPNRLDETSPHGNLAAVGVAFLLVVAVNRCLRGAGWYGLQGGGKRGEPNPVQWLDIVALGTVCDVVKLTGLNRVLVTQGLKVAAQRGNVGLNALAEVARLDKRPDAWHLCFLLGPRVNAGGRVGESTLGARILSTEDPDEARELARRLDAYNTERREIEARVLVEAEAQVAANLAKGIGSNSGENALAFACSEGWHPGVIGIVASRLVERFNRPAIVVALSDGIGKGSGRSVKGVDLGTAVIAARQAGLLTNGGGHPMAAGLTVESGKVGDLVSFLAERLAADLTRARAEGEAGRAISIDGTLAVEGARPDLCRLVSKLGPFGAGNPEPRFALMHARIGKAERIGEDHIRVFLTGNGGGRIKAMSFRSADQPLGKALLEAQGRSIHVAGKLRLDDWMGTERVELLIDDAAPAA
ncbi:MAG: single-stranded-DNA-specific exonuclease RecJ [Gemmatimonas sp.]